MTIVEVIMAAVVLIIAALAVALIANLFFDRARDIRHD
jgi:hypothetical protein